MNTANRLTVGRIFLAFICIWLIVRNTLASICGAFAVFVVASLTDFLDGYLARKKQIASDLGKILDPIADKILIIGVFLAFVELGVLKAWMVGVIMLREFIVTGLRLYCLNKGLVLEAKRFGKHKTISQIVGVVFIFITVILFNLVENKTVNFFYHGLIPIVMWYVVLITLFSGVYYFWENRRAIKTF
ncbi:MAG: CDP-diacylglycerol--glycerol-3-phosphate 3-phosphatidyltransferase [Candidatus Omnitrophota bacterium]|nr:MAG: CDP-diacylglycerol--glycerol-3-phosphate 3-phosphatidyltransferase [Candidatus Omnitrophota bacterium]